MARSQGRASALRELVALIRNEWVDSGRDWTAPGFRAMAVYRFGVWVRERRTGRRILFPIYRTLYRYIRNQYGIELPHRTKVGAHCRIVHQNGIVIHPKTVLGDNCVILQNVTIGAPSRERSDEAPTLGDRVFVGAGAVIVGRISIGDDVKIGPNAVVTTDIPSRATVFGNPARVIPAPEAAAKE